MPLPSTVDIEHDLAAVGAALRAVTAVVRGDAGRRAARRGPLPGGHGSGIVWADDGTVVTNAHVAPSDAASVTLADGRTADARVVARDPRHDLAILRADRAMLGPLPLPTPALGEPSALRPGELVIALGHPLGVAHALAVGVVHAAPDDAHAPWLRADIRLAPGNSGGPLADARGRIVGVNSMIVGGLGVAVSVDAVRRLLAALAPRPTLGARLQPVRVRLEAEATPVAALLVVALDPSGAASRGGIVAGDVLLGHAGRRFRSAEELAALLRDVGPHRTVSLDVVRAGRRLTCEVRLGAAHDPALHAA